MPKFLGDVDLKFCLPAACHVERSETSLAAFGMLLGQTI